MLTHARAIEYRRRRHRLASHRKGAQRSRHHTLPAAAAAMQPFSEFSNGHRLEFRDALRSLTGKICCYEAIIGLLYRCNGDCIRVHLVVSRPMTTPVSLLAEVWQKELNRNHPGFDWHLDVSTAPPETLGRYCCVYWCQY